MTGQEPTPPTDPTPPADPTPPPADPPTGKWYEGLSDPDMRNNPTLQKYASAEEAHKGHLELAKSFGQDKVAWPKDEKDLSAWAEVNKRMGIPETADGYNLDSIKRPDGEGAFNKADFQQFAHAMGATDKGAQAGWKHYTDVMSTSYAEQQNKITQDTETANNALKQEWGEAYETKTSQAQALIETLSKDPKQIDRLTAQMMSNADDRRFLAEIATNYAEHSIGGFQEKQTFTLTPDAARQELDTILASSDYNNDDIRVRQPLIDRSLDLRKMITPSQ